MALDGPSRPLDPRRDAVRPDLADIRLADRVFAPHYVEPVLCALAADGDLRERADAQAPVILRLSRGDAFELMDVTGGVAWGRAVAPGLVGYLDAAAVAAR